MSFIIRFEQRLGETLKLPRLSKVLVASRFRPTSWKLQSLVSNKILKVSVWWSRSRRHGSRVSSRSWLIRSRAHLFD